MQLTLWQRAADAVRNFARSPLPTTAVWISDGLSGLGVDLYGRAVEWRMKRRAGERSHVWAVVDAALLTALVGLLIWGVL